MPQPPPTPIPWRREVEVVTGTGIVQHRGLSQDYAASRLIGSVKGRTVASACVPVSPQLASHTSPTAGVGFLRTNGLLPADDSSDDDVNYAEAAGVEW